MKSIVLTIALAFSLVAFSFPSCAQDSKKEVLQAAQSVLDAINAGDTAAFRSLFLPNAMIYTVREKDGQPVTASRSFMADKFSPDVVIREEMKAAGVEVQVHGHAAQVWAPYHIWVNGTFSHCGVDVFTLLETNQGWRVATLTYTIEKAGCEAR